MSKVVAACLIAYDVALVALLAIYGKDTNDHLSDPLFAIAVFADIGIQIVLLAIIADCQLTLSRASSILPMGVVPSSNDDARRCQVACAASCVLYLYAWALPSAAILLRCVSTCYVNPLTATAYIHGAVGLLAITGSIVWIVWLLVVLACEFDYRTWWAQMAGFRNRFVEVWFAPCLWVIKRL